MADFGLSTLFRLRGQERPLNQCCGSIPYMAPEVLAGVLHKAEPIDMWAYSFLILSWFSQLFSFLLLLRWSCGIVLVAMLTGELPWQQAIPELSVSYKNWASGKCMVFKNPWAKVDNTALCKFVSYICQTFLPFLCLLKHLSNAFWSRYPENVSLSRRFNLIDGLESLPPKKLLLISAK